MKSTIRVSDQEGQFIFRCLNCYQQLFPSLKVRIGDLHVYKREDTLLLNPIQLRQYLEERLQLDASYRNPE